MSRKTVVVAKVGSILIGTSFYFCTVVQQGDVTWSVIVETGNLRPENDGYTYLVIHHEVPKI